MKKLDENKHVCFATLVCWICSNTCFSLNKGHVVSSLTIIHVFSFRNLMQIVGYIHYLRNIWMKCESVVALCVCVTFVTFVFHCKK